MAELEKSKIEIKFNKYITISIIIALFVFILYYLWPYRNGVFGAFILFVLFLPIYKFFKDKLKINKKVSGILIIILVIIIVIIPSYFIVTNAYNQISNITIDKSAIIDAIDKIDQKIPALNLVENVNKQISNFVNWTGDLLIKGVTSAITTAITLIILFFILYYLLVYSKEVKNELKEFLPFNNKNSNILYTEFKKITYATVVATGLVAIVQGLLLGLSFWIFGIKGAVLWGLLAAIFSFLPIVGVPLIWVPYAIYFIVQQNYLVGIGLIVSGLIINYIEYFIRPPLQKKMGNLHPLTSILGIFIGLAAFGIVGIVIGPLLISYFLIIFKMYKDEYIVKKNKF
ncbi:MAG: AI-2E family transporter [archaeon]|jgi:predicted PurR-regulated permease PerM|nr:AI-2E family transporter [archaeon]MDD2477371.1 AI-2E family transporter [Candidatus ainarchaeum sp.]MDD3084516.1 AI-2E family transporter [Candidatus ainarchaeum sp.]MDD4220797.1 AI-2E family transporter [Candidatus ainarchaeum sp.]MDD4662296.1 AI-2E family transporter [Candidatus ainarchaeum sp.]